MRWDLNLLLTQTEKKNETVFLWLTEFQPVFSTEYAALRPREPSAAATAAAAAAVAAAAAASTSQQGLTDSLTALQALGEMTIKSIQARRSSQDSG